MLNVELDIVRICELIIPLAKDPTLNLHLALLLAEILAMREIIFTEYQIVDFCISELFYYLEPDSLELSILATATLRFVFSYIKSLDIEIFFILGTEWLKI